MSIPTRLHEQARPHQFRTRNAPTEAQRTRSNRDKNTATSTKPIVIPPLITVWLQVRVLPGPPAFAREAREGCRAEAHSGEGGRCPRATARQATIPAAKPRGSRFQPKYRKQPHA